MREHSIQEYKNCIKINEDYQANTTSKDLIPNIISPSEGIYRNLLLLLIQFLSLNRLNLKTKLLHIYIFI